MGKGALSLGMLSAFFFLFAGVVMGGHIKDHVVQYSLEGTTEWEVSRGCAVTAGGAYLLAKKLTGVVDVLETKSIRYKLSAAEDISGIKGFVAVYLDHASLETFGRYRRGCFVDERVIRRVSFPEMFSNPDTGILDIDGSEKGAEIFIDRVKKGNIRQAFVLSVGSHRWKTMKCDEHVQIRANETLDRYCDKK